MAATKKPAASKRKTTTARKTTRKPAVKAAPKPIEPLTEEQRQATLEAYYALKQAGLPIPKDLQVVETWITEVQEQQVTAQAYAEKAEGDRIAKANIEGPWFVRNCYPAPFNFRLDRQTEKRRIELKPRGAPGDLHPLKDEDLSDSILVSNVNIGLIEIIPAGEAQLVIEKQTTNMGTRVHAPFAVIQKEYADHAKRGMDVNPNPELKIEAEYGKQGVTVAYTDPNVLAGKVLDRQVAKGNAGGLQRVRQGEPQFTQPAPTMHSAYVPTAGNPAIISQGGPMGDNAQAKVADDIARRRGAGGIEAGMGGPIQVTVEPVQRN